MAKKLKSLTDHNKEKLVDIQAKKSLKGNDIACPDCGKELMDSGGGMDRVMMQYYVECNKCGFQGLRY